MSQPGDDCFRAGKPPAAGKRQGATGDINKGSLSQQIGTNLLREMATVAQTDEKMQTLLQENGFNLTANPTASPAP